MDLAKRGGRIYLACRDMVKADTARLEIIHQSGNRNIFTKKLDLNSFESIRKFVEEYVELLTINKTKSSRIHLFNVKSIFFQV